MYSIFSVARVCVPVLLLLSAGPAQAWFGPSERDPYAIGDAQAAVSAAAPAVGWRWVDARAQLQIDNVAIRDGYQLGDAVFRPRPFDFLQAEFARRVEAHPARDALRQRLQGQTLRLVESEVTVGLWIRLNERQSGNWDMVRVRLVVEWDGGRYEALDTHPFRLREKPSPVSAPMQAVVQSLVNQIHLFATGASTSTATESEPEPDAPTDADLLAPAPPSRPQPQ